MHNKRIVRRNDIFYADLSPVLGAEQDGVRPVLVVQNDVGNEHSPTIIICPLTSAARAVRLPTHVRLGCDFGLKKDSVVFCEQIRAIDKSRLRSKIGAITKLEIINELNRALHISIGLTEHNDYKHIENGN